MYFMYMCKANWSNRANYISQAKEIRALNAQSCYQRRRDGAAATEIATALRNTQNARKFIYTIHRNVNVTIAGAAAISQRVCRFAWVDRRQQLLRRVKR